MTLRLEDKNAEILFNPKTKEYWLIDCYQGKNKLQFYRTTIVCDSPIIVTSTLELNLFSYYPLGKEAVNGDCEKRIRLCFNDITGNLEAKLIENNFTCGVDFTVNDDVFVKAEMAA